MMKTRTTISPCPAVVRMAKTTTTRNQTQPRTSSLIFQLCSTTRTKAFATNLKRVPSGKKRTSLPSTKGDFESGKIVREREKATNALSKKPQVAKKAQLVLVQTGSSRRPKSADALSSPRLPHEVTSSTKKVTLSTKTGNVRRIRKVSLFGFIRGWRSSLASRRTATRKGKKRALPPRANEKAPRSRGQRRKMRFYVPSSTSLARIGHSWPTRLALRRA
mmetsp:Transcript_7600/g.23823  ORF Transcript_7600/g.23823 Transcript_7600/m.23823 type:complete len:219 (+) Transcript_7600:1039-1695(+)